MTGDSSHDLIERLVGDLQAVRRTPPLRSLFGTCLGVAALIGLAVLGVYGLKPGLMASLLGDPVYAAVLVGLVVSLVAGCLAALASAVPGRESVVRGGAAAALGGLVLAAGVGVASAAWGDADVALGSADGVCILRGMLFAALPGTAVLWLAARGWSGRPSHTVALGLVGAGATGALLVHLTCPAVDPLHLVWTHTSTPLLLAAALTAVLTPVMGRLAR